MHPQRLDTRPHPPHLLLVPRHARATLARPAPPTPRLGASCLLLVLCPLMLYVLVPPWSALADGPPPATSASGWVWPLAGASAGPGAGSDARPVAPGPGPDTRPVRPVRPARGAGPPRVTRGFDPPDTPYGAGHRGVDLAGFSGEPVLAAGRGVVSYAAVLAGRGVVAVTHPDGLRTTYEPVRPLVRVGQPVAPGRVLGFLVAGHAGCPQSACLHWGLLRSRDYLDPLGLLRRGPVRLLPVSVGPAGPAPPGVAPPAPDLPDPAPPVAPRDPDGITGSARVYRSAPDGAGADRGPSPDHRVPQHAAPHADPHLAGRLVGAAAVGGAAALGAVLAARRATGAGDGR